MADMQNIIRTIEIRHRGTVWFRISIHLCFGSSGHPTGVHGNLPTVMITYFTAANVWANGARGKRVTEAVGRKVGNEMAKIPQCSEGTGEGLEFLWHPQSHQSMHQRLENKMEKRGWWMMGLNRLPSSNGLINLSIFDIPYVHNSFMTYYIMSYVPDSVAFHHCAVVYCLQLLIHHLECHYYTWFVGSTV